MADMITKTERLPEDSIAALVDAHARFMYEKLKDPSSEETFDEIAPIIQFQLCEAAMGIVSISAKVIIEQGYIKPSQLDTVAELQKLGKGSKVLSTRSKEVYWSEGNGEWSGTSGLSYPTTDDLWLFEAPLILVVEEKK